MTVPRSPAEIDLERDVLRKDIARMTHELRRTQLDYERAHITLSRNMAVARLWALDGRTSKRQT